MQRVSQKKSKNGKPKEGAFLQHYLCSVVQARVWHETTKAHINHVDPQEYGWKHSDAGFIAIEMEDDISELLLTVRGC